MIDEQKARAAFEEVGSFGLAVGGYFAPEVFHCVCHSFPYASAFK